MFPRPKLLADRNAHLRFDLAFTVLPPNHDLCPKTPIFSAASSNFRLQPKFRLHHLVGLGESFQTVLMSMGPNLPQVAQKREDLFATKWGFPKSFNFSSKQIIAMLGISRPEFCADRNRQLHFDQT